MSLVPVVHSEEEEINRLKIALKDVKILNYDEKLLGSVQYRTELWAMVKIAREGIPTKALDMVNHPPHYKAKGVEVIDVLEAFELDYHRGNAVKYILRAANKGNMKQDLEKAVWYLNRKISKL